MTLRTGLSGPGRLVRPGLLGCALVLLAGTVTPATATPAATVTPRAAAPDAACAGLQEDLRGASRWRVLAAPAFPAGPVRVSVHALDPEDADRWYVSNGRVVMRSTDAGCSWQESYRLPDTPTAEAPFTSQDRITELATTSAGGAGLVLAGVSIAPPPESGTVVDPLRALFPQTGGAATVLRSDDGGSSWALSLLAAPVGSPGPLKIAPSDPSVVYAAAGGELNASDDGGRSWTPLPPALAEDQTRDSALPIVTSLDIDPLDPLSLYAVVATIPLISNDGGRTWRGLGQGTRYLGGTAIWHSAGAPARIAFPRNGKNPAPLELLLRSDDGGATFTPVPQPGAETQLESIAAAAEPGDAVIAGTDSTSGQTRERVLRLTDADEQAVDVDEFGLAPRLMLRDVQADRATLATFAFRSADGSRLVTYQQLTAGGELPVIPDPLLVEIPPFEPPPAPVAAPARLTPVDARVVVEPGSRQDLAYRLDLPARPRRLDVFFLLDTSGSSGSYIRGLALGLAELSRSLAESGADVQFGLGEYQTPAPASAPCATGGAPTSAHPTGTFRMPWPRSARMEATSPATPRWSRWRSAAG